MTTRTKNTLSNPHDVLPFDRWRLRILRDRCAGKLSDHDFLLHWTTMQLADRIRDVTRKFPVALLIGSGRLRTEDEQELETQGGIETLIRMDLSNTLLRTKTGARIQADEEFLPLADESLDLVIAPFTLHSINDLPGALIQIRKALKPDGLFLAALPGEGTLNELRAVLMQAELSITNGASPRIAPFADKRQLGALMQRAEFALPVIDSEKVTVTYENAFKLMHDLRGMGEGNALSSRKETLPGKALMMEAARLYHEQFAEPDGRIPASFEIIFLTGWCPHESQQQPLRPGCAEHSLADALKAKDV